MEPSCERFRQRGSGGARGFLTLRLRCRFDIQRNAKVAVLGPDLFERGHAGEARFGFEVLIGPHDALQMLLGQEALGAFAGDFVYCVDEQDFPAPGFGLLRAADDNAGFHGRVIKQVRTQAEHALYEVGLDELAADLGFLLPEQHAVRP